MGKHLTNKECVVNGHVWQEYHRRVQDLDNSSKTKRTKRVVDVTRRCGVCGDMYGQDTFTGKEVYVRNPNFDVRKPVVAYRIRDDSVVPDIRINGEDARVVSCGYQYATSGGDNLGINCFTATICLDSECKGEHETFVQHVVSIDHRTGQVFYQ